MSFDLMRRRHFYIEALPEERTAMFVFANLLTMCVR